MWNSFALGVKPLFSVFGLLWLYKKKKCWFVADNLNKYFANFLPRQPRGKILR